jgi:protein-tyrosine phosphatase
MAEHYPPTPQGAEALMLDFYAELPRTMAHVFGEVLLRISNGAFPCIIHCSAGKDRTGMAVALLLSALGFDRAAIVTDYAASAKSPRLEGAMARSVERDEAVSRFRARYPADARAIMLEARPAYILAGLDVIDAHHGGMTAYLASIGVDDAAITRLRAHLLEPSKRGNRT